MAGAALSEAVSRRRVAPSGLVCLLIDTGKPLCLTEKGAFVRSLK